MFLNTEWRAEEEKRVWWYLSLNLKPTTVLIGRLRSSCLVTAFYDAIRTCCNEKFKLTTELFSGTSTWDIDVHTAVKTCTQYSTDHDSCWCVSKHTRPKAALYAAKMQTEGNVLAWVFYICVLWFVTNWDDVPLMFQIHFCSCNKHDWGCILHEAAFGVITTSLVFPHGCVITAGVSVWIHVGFGCIILIIYYSILGNDMFPPY